MIAEIQCLARPAGTETEPYLHIEAAIHIVETSGLHYEVSALGTTVEGEPDEIWALLRRVHEAPLRSGSDGLVTVIKVAESREGVPQATMGGLTAKFR